MKQKINIVTVFAAMLAILFSCSLENDFYEVGRQPVFLEGPKDDTTFVLNIEAPDSLVFFGWKSKRHYIPFLLHIDDNTDFEDSFTADPGISDKWKFSYRELDSIAASYNVGIGETVKFYWTVEVVDPETGWCDEVKCFSVKRFELPDNKIVQTSPADGSVVNLTKNDTDSLTFAWDCIAPIEDYRLIISGNAEFTDIINEVETGNKKSYRLSYKDIDDYLIGSGIKYGEAKGIWWKVTGTGNLLYPVEGSDATAMQLFRAPNVPVDFCLSQPAADAVVELSEDIADEQVVFDWTCDTTGISYTFRLYDSEYDIEYRVEDIADTEYSISQADLDILLDKTFGMVPSQKKKFIWEVIPSDSETYCTIKESVRTVYITRYKANYAASPIALTSAPEDGSVLDMTSIPDETPIMNLAWNCTAENITYTVEYSLAPEMDKVCSFELGKEKIVSLTPVEADRMLMDLGKAYMTARIYYRISSTSGTKTSPSEVRSITLTGKLRPFTDLRDPANPETYKVVKIGDDIWMAGNLRAMCYSDGTDFMEVDPIDRDGMQYPAAKKWSDDLMPEKQRGVYYSWPIAIRNYREADTSHDKIHQGVCPDGWHVSTMQDWENLAAHATEGGHSLKSSEYWATPGSDALGINIVPNGKFWHLGVWGPDNTADKASFWTPTAGEGTTAYMYELFGWSNDIAPWFFNSRPYAEGDTIASMGVAVRCVKDR